MSFNRKFVNFIFSILGDINVIKAFDYETTKVFEFYVIGVSYIIQNPSESVTMQARVIITVIDKDDNCPILKTPTIMQASYSSPIAVDTLIGMVEYSDSDSSLSHNLSLSVSDVKFKINSKGQIVTAVEIASLVEENYNVTITSSAGGVCTSKSYLELQLTVCPTPMTYMFNNNSNYEETVYENKTVNSKFTIVPTIFGSYATIYSIVEASAKALFSINSTTGIYQHFLIA